MYNQFFILFILSFLLTFTISHFNSVFAVDDDGFFSVSPEDYYNFQDDGEEESKVSNQLQEENNTSDQNALPTASPPTNNSTN